MGKVPTGRYGFRSTASIQQNFSDISVDIYKFVLPVSNVNARNLTDVGEEGVIYMTLAF